MPSWLILVVIVAAYLLLTQWILPKFGVST